MTLHYHNYSRAVTFNREYVKYRDYSVFVMLLMMALYIIVNLLFFWGFDSSIIDIGTFDQALWQASHSLPLHSTVNWPYTPDNSFWSVHFAPLVFILTPLYWIKAMPEWLIIVHEVTLCITMWILYETCYRLGAGAKMAFFWALLYFLQPNIIFTSMWEFHEQSLAIPTIALGVLAVVEKRLLLLILCEIALVLTKEHYGVAVVGFGLLWGWAHRDWKVGFSMMLAGIVTFYLVVFQIIPWLTGAEHPMFQESSYGAGNRHLDRYAWLKWPWKDALGFSLYLLQEQITVLTLIYLLVPLLFLPFLGFMFIAPAGADLAVNLLSNWNLSRDFMVYYYATVIPTFIVAACFGSLRLEHYFRRISAANMLKGAYVVSIIALASLLIPLWSTFFPNLDNITKFGKDFPYPKPLEEILSRLPEDKAVCASGEIGPYFTHRQKIFPFPFGLEYADAVVLRMDIPLLTREIVNPSTANQTSKELLGMYSIDVWDLLRDPNWGVTYWKDRWLLFEKGKPDVVDPKQVEKEILDWKLPWSKPAKH